MAWGYGHRCFFAALGVTVLATGLFAAWMGLGIGGERSVRYVSDLATPLAALAATLLCFRAGRCSPYAEWRAARMALWFLLGGLLAMALSDSAYAYLVEVKGYETGNLLDTGWFAGYVAIALGALCSETRGAATRSADAVPALAALVAPFLPLLLALSVAAVEIELGHRADEVALIMAFVLIALVPVRQVLLLAELVSAEGEQDVNAVKRVQAALGRAIPTESGSPPSRPPGGSQP